MTDENRTDNPFAYRPIQVVKTPDDGYGRYRTLTLERARYWMNRDLLIGDLRFAQERVDALKRLIEMNEGYKP